MLLHPKSPAETRNQIDIKVLFVLQAERASVGGPKCGTLVFNANTNVIDQQPTTKIFLFVK